MSNFNFFIENKFYYFKKHNLRPFQPQKDLNILNLKMILEIVYQSSSKVMRNSGFIFFPVKFKSARNIFFFEICHGYFSENSHRHFSDNCHERVAGTFLKKWRGWTSEHRHFERLKLQLSRALFPKLSRALFRKVLRSAQKMLLGQNKQRQIMLFSKTLTLTIDKKTSEANEKLSINKKWISDAKRSNKFHRKKWHQKSSKDRQSIVLSILIFFHKHVILLSFGTYSFAWRAFVCLQGPAITLKQRAPKAQVVWMVGWVGGMVAGWVGDPKRSFHFPHLR